MQQKNVNACSQQLVQHMFIKRILFDGVNEWTVKYIAYIKTTYVKKYKKL